MKQQTNKSEDAHRKPKTKHIDVRFTEDENDIIEKAAAACGMFKSNYLHDLGLGHQPKQLMTEEQEKALKGLLAARSDLVHFMNALNALPQAARKKLFKNEEFMQEWMKNLKRLIAEIDKIKGLFL